MQQLQTTIKYSDNIKNPKKHYYMTRANIVNRKRVDIANRKLLMKVR